MRGEGMLRAGVSGATRRATSALAGLALAMGLVVPGSHGVASAADAPSPSAVPASPVAGPSLGPVRRIDLVETSMMQILDGAGEPVTVLAVRPGETLEIGVTNGARFPHDLYIGPQDALAKAETADLPGVPAFAGGSRTFTWTVPASVDGLWFGCTVTGHFSIMQGRVVAVVEVMPDLVGLPEPDAVALLQASGLLSVERTEVADPTAEPGTVLAQEPPAGAPVDLGTVVRTTIAVAG